MTLGLSRGPAGSKVGGRCGYVAANSGLQWRFKHLMLFEDLLIQEMTIQVEDDDT